MTDNSFVQKLLNSEIIETVISSAGVNYLITPSPKPTVEHNTKCQNTGQVTGKIRATTYSIKRDNVTLAYLNISKKSYELSVKVFISNNPYAMKSKSEQRLTTPTKELFLKLVKSYIDYPHQLIDYDGKITNYPATMLGAFFMSQSGQASNGTFTVSHMISGCNSARQSAMRQLKQAWGAEWLFRDCEMFSEGDSSTDNAVKQYLAVTCGDTIAFSVAGCLHIPEGGSTTDEQEKIQDFINLLEAYELLLSTGETHVLTIYPNNGKPQVALEKGKHTPSEKAEKVRNRIQNMITKSSFLTEWTQTAIKGRDDLTAIVIPPSVVTLKTRGNRI